MEYVKIEGTGLKISQLALGTMNFGNYVNESTALKILDTAYDLGINLIDTANCYGKSEAIIGKWLHDSGVRDQLIISTKVGWPVGDSPNDQGLSRKHILHQLQSSLHKLQTDYLDIYQPHYFDSNENITESVRIFGNLVNNGSITTIGAPIFTKAFQILRWYYEAKMRDLPNLGIQQMVYSLVSRSMDRTDLLSIAETMDLPLLGFAPLGGGLLTGKYTSDQPFPANGRQMFRTIYEEKKTDEIMQILKEIASEHDLAPYQISLAWVINQGVTTSTVVGVSNPSQLEGLCSVLDLKLSTNELEQLSAVSDSHHIW